MDCNFLYENNLTKEILLNCFDFSAPPPSSSSSSGSYNDYNTNDIGYSDNTIYNIGGYSDNTIYNSGGYSDNTIYNSGGYSDNNIYNSIGYSDNNIYNNFPTVVEGGGPVLDQQRILLSQPGWFDKVIYKSKYLDAIPNTRKKYFILLCPCISVYSLAYTWVLILNSQIQSS